MSPRPFLSYPASHSLPACLPRGLPSEDFVWACLVAGGCWMRRTRFVVLRRRRQQAHDTRKGRNTSLQHLLSSRKRAFPALPPPPFGVCTPAAGRKCSPRPPGAPHKGASSTSSPVLVTHVVTSTLAHARARACKDLFGSSRLCWCAPARVCVCVLDTHSHTFGVCEGA